MEAHASMHAADLRERAFDRGDRCGFRQARDADRDDRAEQWSRARDVPHRIHAGARSVRSYTCNRRCTPSVTWRDDSVAPEMFLMSRLSSTPSLAVLPTNCLRHAARRISEPWRLAIVENLDRLHRARRIERDRVGDQLALADHLIDEEPAERAARALHLPYLRRPAGRAERGCHARIERWQRAEFARIGERRTLRLGDAHVLRRIRRVERRHRQKACRKHPACSR